MLLSFTKHVSTPDQTSPTKRNCTNISSTSSSQQISVKNFECKNKIAMKKLLKNLSLGEDFKLGSTVDRLVDKNKTHNISDLRS